jgi:hypothetical protein
MASVDVRRKEAAATMRRKLPLDLAETEPGHPQLVPNARQDSVQPTVEHVPDLLKARARKGAGPANVMVQGVLTLATNDARFLEVRLAGNRVLQQLLVFRRGEEVHYPHIPGNEQSAFRWRRPGGPSLQSQIGNPAQISAEIV